MTTKRDDDPRGRRARRPGHIPLRGWKEVLVRTKDEITDDHVNIVAAGVAFYLFLALFPALFAAVSIYGLVADPAQVQQQVSQLSGFLPGGLVDLLSQQLGDLAATSPATLGWSALLSVLLALWSAAKGAKALIGGVNIAYDEDEKRGFLRVQGVSLLFTLGAVAFLALSLTLIAVVPGVVERLPLPAAGFVIAFVLRWVLLLALILVALAVIYRYAPSRDEPRWTWLGLGSFVAAGLWMIASILFSYYAETFGSFNETYGAIAGVVVALLWLQISALAILVGAELNAELNAELEHQTTVDTTEGRPQPMGRRGAVKADTLPEDAPAE